MKEMIKNNLFAFGMLALGFLWIGMERFSGRVAFFAELTGALRGFAWVFWLCLLTGAFCLLRLPIGIEFRCDNSFLKRFGPELLILFLTAASLWMLTESGYYWDDAVNSTQYLAEKYDEIPLWQNVLSFMGKYIKLGRINILSFYYYFFFYIENVSVYKTLIIFLILLDQVIFSLLLREIGCESSLRRLGMLLLPVIFQTRAYQDPISGFYGLMQVLTAEMMLTAYFELRWLRRGAKKDAFWSMFFFAVGLMTYEVCFPFIVMVFLLLWEKRHSFWKALRDVLPYGGIVLVMVLAIAAVRIRFAETSTYVGVTFQLEPLGILRAYLSQLSAALPLSMYSSRHELAVMGNTYLAERTMNYQFADFLKAIRIEDIFVGASALLLLGSLRSEGRSLDRGASKRTLLILGVSFFFLPGMTVAVSQRYQGQLYLGQGYLPVYMQYFGTACFFLYLGSWLSSRNMFKVPAFRSFAAAFCVLLLMLGMQNDRAVTKVMNHAFYESREAGVKALRSGILDFLPEGSRLLADNDQTYIWETNWNSVGNYSFYSIFSGRNDIHAGGAELLKEGTEGLYLISYAADPSCGMTRLGRLVSAETEEGVLRSVKADQVLYFINGACAGTASIQLTDAEGGTRKITPQAAQRVRETKDGILYRLDETEVIDFDSLTVDLLFR